MFKALSYVRIAAVNQPMLSTNVLKLQTDLKGFMDCDKPLQELSKEQLIAKVQGLQKQCNSLKAASSKYEAMAQKFQRSCLSRRKKKKTFDPKTTAQRKIALKVAYFGWDYMGLQDNPGLNDTIEKILFRALGHTKLLLGNIEDAEYSKCGRTDKGVSAFSQVFCLKLRSNIKGQDASGNTNENPKQTSTENPDQEMHCEGPGPSAIIEENEITESKNACAMGNMLQDSVSENSDQEFDYCGILNRVLPDEIRVTAWAYVEDADFSARHRCVGRIYKYYFPLGSLDIAAMNAASKKLIGTHDFRNFCKINAAERLVYVRTLRDFNIDTVSLPELNSEYSGPYQMCVATIVGTGFLYHQVRYMMSILFLIGMGFENADVIDDLLDIEKTPRRPQYGTASEFPLVLYDCKFEKLKWSVSEEARLRLREYYQKFWASMMVKTMLARSMWDKLSNDSLYSDPTSTSLQVKDGSQEPYNMRNVTDYNFVGFLLQERWTSKQYRKVIKRQTGNSLEEKIESMETKRQRKLERMEASESHG